MSNPANALQKGIYDRLLAYSALTTALGGNKVYDHVPQGTLAPYVVIGEDTLIEADTKSKNGWEATIIIHCWDFEKAGRKSVKTLQGLIYDALHKSETNVTITGFSLVLLYCEYQESFQDVQVEGASDHYYHGVQRFRAIITV